MNGTMQFSLFVLGALLWGLLSPAKGFVLAPHLACLRSAGQGVLLGSRLRNRRKIRVGRGAGVGSGWVASAGGEGVRVGDVVQLEVTGLAFAGSQKGGGGSGVARTEDGLVVFVEGGLPGSVVQAKVTRMEQSHASAAVQVVVKESPHQRDPGCKHWHEGCGGCGYLNMDYAAQLPFKAAHVADVLEKIGGMSGVKVTGPSGAASETRYRNNMQYSIWQPPVQKGKYFATPERLSEGKMTIGLHGKRAFDNVLDVDDCLLPSDAALRAYKATKDLVLGCGLTTDKDNGGLESILVRSSGEGADEKVMVSIVTKTRVAEFLLRLVKPLREACPEVSALLNVFPNDGGMGDARETMEAFASGGKTRGKPRQTAKRGGRGGPGMEKVGGRYVASSSRERQEDGSGAGGEYVALFGDPCLEHTVRGLRFKISSRAFFQTNTRQTEALYSAVEGMVKRGKHDTVVDLYCGSGTIGLCIAKNTDAKLVVGIEKNADSVADARHNAELNGIKNCVFACGDVPKVLAQMSKKGLERIRTLDHALANAPIPPGSRADVAICDPPRAGVGEDGVRDLVDLEPSRIVYVSCNPATLARDAKALWEQGAYVLVEVQCVDMFPNTPHIETVALFER